MWSSKCQPCMLRKFAVQRIIKKEEKGKNYGSFFIYFFDRTNETNNWWGKGYDQEEVERGSNVTHVSF